MESTDVMVRVALEEDLDGLRAVARATWHATYSGSIPDADIERFLDSSYSIERLHAALGRLGGGLLVGHRDGEVVGYAQSGRNRSNGCELYAIYVLPEEQGSGVGYRLWRASCEHLRSLGCAAFEVWVLASNSGARRFYERQGAVLSGARPFTVGEVVIEESGYSVAL
jgi:GNAT superfamily N-acetyltransferase